MKAIITNLERSPSLFLLLGALLLILILGSSTVKADLGGSKVVFEPVSDGAACYVPNRSQQTLCFEAVTVSSDGEDVTTSFWKFPSDWTVYNPVIQPESATCTNGAFSGGLGWTGMGSGEGSLTHTRLHEVNGTCTITYCFPIKTGTTSTVDAPVSWIWYGPETNPEAPPHRPCSSDGYTGPLISCDYSVDPPATVPVCEHVTLNILPETLPAGEVGSFYSLYLTAEPASEPYYWQSSGLSAGVSLISSSGHLQGTPTSAGTINFTAYVEGSGWSDGERNYSLTIHPTLTFNPSTLPAARLNTAYTQEVSVSGRDDETPILTLDSGTLPVGITFNTGAFTGTPTETGKFENIVIKATYTDGLVKTKTYTLNVYSDQLFTWDPPIPDEKSEVTFSPVDGFSSYYWTKGYNPGETCDYYGWYGYKGINFTFNTSGDYQVCLKVNDGYGNEFIDSQWVTVNNIAPEIYDVWIYPSPSFPGMAVSGEFEFDRGPAPFTCQVDWGDGSSPQDFDCLPTYEKLPEHTYTAAGSYDIQIWVTDGDGLTGTTSIQHEVVYVFARPSYETWLASNSDPTTVELWGLAAIGHTPLTFTIEQVSTLGTLGIPSPGNCEQYKDKSVMLCRATVQYTPPSDTGTGLYTGNDSFDFFVDDGQGNSSSPVTVTLWVDENAPPTALAGSATVSSVNPTIVILWATDPDVYGDYGEYHDRMTFIIDEGPSHGTLTEVGWTNCYSDWGEYGESLICNSLYEYTPDPGTTATEDSFTFHVNDSHYDSGIAAFDLTLHTPTTLVVNATDDVVDENGCDAAHCSLREAVEAVVIGDIITFDLGERSAMITLGGQEIRIEKDMVINGPGADKLAISAGENSRVFNIGNEWEMPVNVIISGLQIRDGRDFAGGGVFIREGAELTMNDCVIGPNNIVDYAGGGIFNERGSLILNRCTVTENEGTGTLGGAGITTVGGATTTLINSTVSGNITNNFGGGIYVAYDGLVRLIQSTVSGNISNANYMDEDEERGGGAGIFIDTEGQLELQNSIVAGNTDMSDPATAGHEKWPDVHGYFTSLGGNLIGNPTGSTNEWASTDQVGTVEDPLDPMLGSLLVNAPGNTPTMALLTGSPAIDAVGCLNGVTVDQRGIGRPQGSACDIGAYEFDIDMFLMYLPLIRR